MFLDIAGSKVDHFPAFANDILPPAIMVFRKKKNHKLDILEEEVDSEDFIADIEIESDEDEEIDEDMAFDDEDEELYGDHFAKRTRKSIEQDELEEDEEDEVDGIFEGIEEQLEDEVEEEEEEEEKPTALSKLDVGNLMSVIGDSKEFFNLKKKVESFKDPAKIRKATVKAPLAPILQDQINREVAYKSASKDISKWTSIIKSNREADNLSFPLNEPVHTYDSPLNLDDGPCTEMEKQISSILKQSNMESEEKILENEDLALNKLSVEEAAERRAELQKLRALLFYQEQKLKRMAKIKSKTYRKILKKEKDRKAANNEEDKDEEEEKLSAEYARAKERLTLKHKSKFHKNLKGGKESLQAINEQLDIHSKLMNKIQGGDSESEDEILGEGDEFKENVMEVVDSIANEELDAPKKGLFAMKFMQRAAEKKKQEALELAEQIKRDLQSDSESDEEQEKKPSESPIAEKPNRIESQQEEAVDENDWLTPGHSLQSVKKKKLDEKVDKLNMKSAKIISSQNVSWNTAAIDVSSKKMKIEESLDDDISFQQQKLLVQKAFINDNLVNAFKEEKERVVAADNPQPEDLTLPGWGQWGGSSVKQKSNVQVLKKHADAIDPKKRKDAKLDHVIITERKLKKAAKYMIEDTPFPYENRKHYERTLDMPIGKEWNTTSKFQENIIPRVSTKMGKIIDPIKYVKQAK